VAARFKALVYGRSPAEFVGSNPCRECCVMSGRGLYDGLITRPEESYRIWRVVVCDLETWWMILDSALVLILRSILFLTLNPINPNSHLKIFTYNCSTPNNHRSRHDAYYVPSYCHKWAGALEFGVFKVFVHIPQSLPATSNFLISALMYCGRAISDQNSDSSACSGTVLFRLYIGE